MVKHLLRELKPGLVILCQVLIVCQIFADCQDLTKAGVRLLWKGGCQLLMGASLFGGMASGHVIALYLSHRVTVFYLSSNRKYFISFYISPFNKAFF